jgi:glyceraldehyde 3-phosphate dehydrogenase
MVIRAAINGYGRIGRSILRAIYESGRQQEIQVVAVNDLHDAAACAHLTAFDSTHGPFHGVVRPLEADAFSINGDCIRVLQAAAPTRLPWRALEIDLVFECSGRFASREQAAAHQAAGAGKVLISAAAGGDIDATIVYGVNHHLLRPEARILSNASCTTNCLAVLLQPLHAALGIVRGTLLTVHPLASDQRLLDAVGSDLRRSRAGAANLIPIRSGAPALLGQVMPALAGRLDGFCLRVPTLNVSLLDLTFQARRTCSADDVNAILQEAAEGALSPVLAYSSAPLVSSDYNHHPASAIVDPALTRVQGSLIRVCAWYDNEWGFANRMLDTGIAWMRSAPPGAHGVRAGR